MKTSKAKLITAALSSALMISVIGGGVSSLVGNSGKGEVVQAASAKNAKEVRSIVLKRFPGYTITKLEKDWEYGKWHWDVEARNGRNEVELSVTQSGSIYGIEYDYDDDYGWDD